MGVGRARALNNEESEMKFSVPIKFGNRVITIEDEAEDLREMFRKMDAYDSLPHEGPSGEEDLEFCHRVVKNAKGQPCTYFSVVCPSARQEFKFGILADGSGLFPKGWEPLQRGAYREREEEEESEASGPSAPAGNTPKADDIDKRAERLVKDGAVKKENGQCTVQDGNARYTVSKDQSTKTTICACRRFNETKKFNPDFTCEHIRAVRKLLAKAEAA
jgi:hypothetical protein